MANEIQLMTRHGTPLSSSRGAGELYNLVSNLPAGTVIEGEWVRQQGVFHPFEVLFAPAAAIEAPPIVHTGAVPYYWPQAPMPGPKSMLALSPGAWRMEKKWNGDRVLVFAQGDGETGDVRTLSCDDRRAVLAKVVAQLGNPQVQLADVVADNFAGYYAQWKTEPFCEGVVMKRRVTPYIAGSLSAAESPNWKKRRFEWD